ncbi:MAG: DUF4276 family protein [Cytophagales bacterium]|nr:MAG: DUF4276 family protein [Cytophagales bacterium]
MRPIIIVVEGPTEQTFIEQCLMPYWFERFGIYEVYPSRIGNDGGNVRVDRLRKDIELFLKQRPNAYVTTLIDYSGNELKKLENYVKCKALPTTDQRIKCIEDNLLKLIDSERFIPFIQKHEFESLLFSSGYSLQAYLKPKTCEAITQTRSQFHGPEDINTNQYPSYRLKEFFNLYEPRKYSKVANGSILALEIGLPTILKECPRFAAWVERIGKLATE